MRVAANVPTSTWLPKHDNYSEQQAVVAVLVCAGLAGGQVSVFGSLLLLSVSLSSLSLSSLSLSSLPLEETSIIPTPFFGAPFLISEGSFLSLLNKEPDPEVDVNSNDEDQADEQSDSEDGK